MVALWILSIQLSFLVQSVGAVERFPDDVSLVSHALTLEDLKEFNPEVSGDNGVPTVNWNLTSEDLVLPDTPVLDNSDIQDLYNTEGLEDIDFVMVHGDDNDWDRRYTTSLRRIADRFLTRELLFQVLQRFRKTKTISQTQCHDLKKYEAAIEGKLMKIAEARRNPLTAFGAEKCTELNYLENFGQLNKYDDVQLKIIEEMKAKQSKTALMDAYWDDFFAGSLYKPELRGPVKFKFPEPLLENGALYFRCKLGTVI